MLWKFIFLPVRERSFLNWIAFKKTKQKYIISGTFGPKSFFLYPLNFPRVSTINEQAGDS